MAAIPEYAELRCVSNFSFLRGASQPEELVERAKQLGYSALAIADECSISGIVRAHTAAKQHIGNEYLVAPAHLRVDSLDGFGPRPGAWLAGRSPEELVG